MRKEEPTTATISPISVIKPAVDPASVLDKVETVPCVLVMMMAEESQNTGYGYYYATAKCRDPIRQCTISRLEIVRMPRLLRNVNQLDGVTVVAYTTAPAIGISSSSDTSSYMKMTANDRTANGIWQFSYNSQLYTFTINPFLQC